MSQLIRGQGGHLGFLIRPKSTKLVEDVDFLFSVKIHEILFNGFREEVENVKSKRRRTIDSA